MLSPVVRIESVAPLHFQISFAAPDIAARAQAGQFVHILPRAATDCDPLLRRAFSILSVREGEIDILFRVEGRGTRWLSMRRTGDVLDVIGPLGHPFDLTPFHVKQPPVVLLVGGGVGVPPLIFLAQTLCARQYPPLFLIGARSQPDVLGTTGLSQMGIETRIATDDGSAGHAGRVTDLLENALSVLPPERSGVVYACGPFPMLKAVAKVAARFGVRAQVSLEENMPCGIGVCNGCVVAMKPSSESSDYGRYRRICIEGPAVWAHEVDWEAY